MASAQAVSILRGAGGRHDVVPVEAPVAKQASSSSCPIGRAYLRGTEGALRTPGKKPCPLGMKNWPWPLDKVGYDIVGKEGPPSPSTAYTAGLPGNADDAE